MQKEIPRQNEKFNLLSANKVSVIAKCGQFSSVQLQNIYKFLVFFYVYYALEFSS